MRAAAALAALLAAAPAAAQTPAPSAAPSTPAPFSAAPSTAAPGPAEASRVVQATLPGGGAVTLILALAPDLRDLEAMLQGMGLQTLRAKAKDGGEKLIARMFMPALPEPLAIVFDVFGCKEAGCTVLQMQAGIADAAMTEAELASFTLRSPSFAAVRVTPERIALNRAVPLVGGVTEPHLKAEITLFGAQAERFLTSRPTR